MTNETNKLGNGFIEGVSKQKRFKVTMETDTGEIVTLTLKASSLSVVVDQVKNRRLPNATGMRSFEVDEIE